MSGEFVNRRGHLLDGVRDASSVLGREQRSVVEQEGLFCQLTSDGRNEDPSWAPDGRHLTFVSNRTGAKQLWVVDIETGRSRQLTRGASVRLPAWSPRLPAE